MSYAEKVNDEKRWYKRVVLINIYHKGMLLKNKKWTLRATARRLGMSLGAVSESIKLAQALIVNPNLEFLKKHEALHMANQMPKQVLEQGGVRKK